MSSDATTTSTTQPGGDGGGGSGTDEDIDIAANVALVRSNIEKVVAATTTEQSSSPVRLVAVSKTKPVSLLQKAYDEANVRVFGENYVQEMVDKVPQLPNDVTWHFIGNLQSNKVNQLLSPFLPDSNLNRLVLETVGTSKVARKLNKTIEEKESTSESKLKVFVQVNTSGEDSKSGVEPSSVVPLCQEIVKECPHLQLLGLMTIGAPGDETCFDTLVQCRTEVADALGMSTDSLELSMGMSGDYEAAISKGSTNVRVGSTIFGARDYSNKK